MPLILLLICLMLFTGGCGSQSSPPGPTPGPNPFGYYDIGSPTVTDIWIDPVSGSDTASGNDRVHPIRTITAAWARIPSGSSLTGTGYRLQLLPGTYEAYDTPDPEVPAQLDSCHGTSQYPIIIQSADGQNKVQLPGLQIDDCSYLYFINLNTVGASAGGDGFHLTNSDHLLIRGCEINGNDQVVGEVLKANQCQYVYVETSNIHHSSYNTALDFVAVQHGHIVKNQIHDAEETAMYLKGGSAYFRIEANEIYNANNSGFLAGEATGFEYFTNPWLHYEAYDIKFINNIIHDTAGAGMGVNGGYNILLAYNTLYRVGSVSHAIEIVHGGRGCGADPSHIAQAQINHDAGGWGVAAASSSIFYIPCRNVYAFNNIVYNPAPFQSAWSHFSTRGEATGADAPPAGCNVPLPSRADTNLVIKGDFISNGPDDLSLGIGGAGEADLDPASVEAQNSINLAIPQLANPAGGDYSPVTGGNVFSAVTYTIPDFSWIDAPTPPTVPA
ncbi:MAG: right-handed parallel beta-helix repeat-containing protein, partial [Candidatus Saganbacteria bacterium]|nr:right-handed parallel beta-helix repeat-containing protein [Candidatus Saganbacteria bacterium]